MPDHLSVNTSEQEDNSRQPPSATELETVVRIAKSAGTAIMAVYERGADEVNSKTASKDDNSPLTEADLAAHHIIVDALNTLTPDIPVVSEEDPSSLAHRTDSGMFWLIDPLDGTKEFIARNGEFTVNIALIIAGHSTWGVVHAPALGLTYWGGQGIGAFKQNDEIDADDASDHLSNNPIADTSGHSADNSADNSTDSSTNNSPEKLPKAMPTRLTLPSPLNDKQHDSEKPNSPIRVVASKSHLNQETESFIRGLGLVDLVQAGSSLKLCKIAEGSADVYPRLAPTCEWDTAAAQAVVEGAGGYVFDTKGNRLQYGKEEVLNPSFIASALDHASLQSRMKICNADF